MSPDLELLGLDYLGKLPTGIIGARIRMGWLGNFVRAIRKSTVFFLQNKNI